MKTILLTLIVTIFSTFVGANSAFEGLTTSKSYKDVKNHNPINAIKYIAEPGVMVYDKKVYLYAANDASVGQLGENPESNGYSHIQSLTIMSSRDLVNWVDHGSIAVAGESGAAKWAASAWAPTAAHKKIDGKEKFFLYFANGGKGIGVLTSDSPTGPFVDPIGKALVDSDTPNCDGVSWLFDPAVFVDDDGTGYLYFGGGAAQENAANPKVLRGVKLGNDMISLADTPVTIEAPYAYEDSGMNKAGDTYFFTYCTNWNSGPYGNAKIAYMTSKNPLGPFTMQGTLFDNPGDYFGTYGNNHHNIIEFNGKWFIFYHTEWLNKQEFGVMKSYRSIHVDVLPFYGDEKFGNAKGTLTGVLPLTKVDPFTANYASMMAWQGGVSVNGAGHTTVSYKKGDWTGVCNVAFGDGASFVTISAASANGAVIRITTGNENGEVVGYITVPATGGADSFTTVSAEINAVSGAKNIFFVASDDVTIDTWVFSATKQEQKPGQNTNPEVVPNPSKDPQPIVIPEPSKDPEPVVVPQPIKDLEPVDDDEEIIIQDDGTVRIPDGWYYIRNPDSKKYLQVKDGRASASTSVVIGSLRKDNAQKWKLTNINNKYITLTSAVGNFMLDVEGGSNNDKTNIQIYHAYSGDAQQFILYKTSVNNAFVIATKNSNGKKALDIDHKYSKENTNVLLWTNEAKSNQIWVFESVDGKTQNAGAKMAYKLETELYQ